MWRNKEGMDIAEKLVYIASPYAGDTERNIAFARAACRLAVDQGFVPVAAHLLYPQFLDDTVPVQRELGIRLGLKLLAACSELWLCGERISDGMQEEWKEAERLGMPVRRIPGYEVEPYLRMPDFAESRAEMPGQAGVCLC